MTWRSWWSVVSSDEAPARRQETGARAPEDSRIGHADADTFFRPNENTLHASRWARAKSLNNHPCCREDDPAFLAVISAGRFMACQS